MKFKPNHICKNPKCPFGDDGAPKQYYACDACDKTGYRRIACSRECYAQIIRLVNPSDMMLPNRTDMTTEEVKEMMDKPTESVMRETMQDLSEFSDEIEAIGLEAVVDLINYEIDASLE